jgi:hypothetical protein
MTCSYALAGRDAMPIAVFRVFHFLERPELLRHHFHMPYFDFISIDAVIPTLRSEYWTLGGY